MVEIGTVDQNQKIAESFLPPPPPQTHAYVGYQAGDTQQEQAQVTREGNEFYTL